MLALKHLGPLIIFTATSSFATFFILKVPNRLKTYEIILYYERILYFFLGRTSFLFTSLVFQSLSNEEALQI